MEPRYLLDTNTIIYIRRNRPEIVRRAFRDLRAGEAVLSVITMGELVYGVTKSSRRAEAISQLRQITALLPVLPLHEETAQVYGAIRAELESRGQMIGNNDLWIAAHSIAAGLTVVTNNEKEFRRVPGLKIENWAH
jgi:tRNA(fMet)-specific endonuclease VapC